MLVSVSLYLAEVEQSCVGHLPRWHHSGHVSIGGEHLSDKIIASTTDGREDSEKAYHFISADLPLSYLRLPRHVLANLCRFLL